MRTRRVRAPGAGRALYVPQTRISVSRLAQDDVRPPQVLKNKGLERQARFPPAGALPVRPTST